MPLTPPRKTCSETAFPCTRSSSIGGTVTPMSGLGGVGEDVARRVTKPGGARSAALRRAAGQPIRTRPLGKSSSRSATKVLASTSCERSTKAKQPSSPNFAPNTGLSSPGNAVLTSGKASKASPSWAAKPVGFARSVAGMLPTQTWSVSCAPGPPAKGNTPARRNGETSSAAGTSPSGTRVGGFTRTLRPWTRKPLIANAVLASLASRSSTNKKLAPRSCFAKGGERTATIGDERCG
mmetsp:Transcript_52112/g.151722  ORF Transcript_52112/g.151722 Transcript_52112/m.151722 type:complete len:237 (+) Transcript_52112:270-980(+)